MRFCAANKDRRKGIWAWDVLDERLRDGEGSSLTEHATTKMLAAPVGTTAAHATEVAPQQMCKPAASSGSKPQDMRLPTPSPGSTGLMPSQQPSSMLPPRRSRRGPQPGARRGHGPRLPRQLAETRWVPDTSLKHNVKDASKIQECHHRLRVRPPNASAGCDCVCADCGEHLSYEGWCLEYSSFGRLPRSSPKGWGQGARLDRSSLEEENILPELFKSSDGQWLTVDAVDEDDWRT